MAHEHPVRDSDLHFVIDPVTRTIKNNSGKITLMQYDHQSEIFTFELPRYIDTHDMSICDKVRVHYINIGSSSKYEPVSGVYEITDLQIDPENEDLVTCSWLLTNNTTQLDGTLNFIIRFSCLTGETIDYSWSTAIYSGIVVSKTIDSTDEVMENTADILEQWKASLKGDPFTYEDFTPEQLEDLRGSAGIVISDSEPNDPDHPVWLDPDGEVGPFDLNITGASVGQVPTVKSVDENGVPTEWEAADMASGGDWEFINEISTNEWISSVTIDQDANGNAFSLKKMMILMTLPSKTNEAGEEQSTAGYACYAVNDRRPEKQDPSSGWSKALFLWTIAALGDYYTVTCFKDGENGAKLFHSDIFKSEGAFSTIKKFEWRLLDGRVGWNKTNFKVYGVRA